MASSMTVGVAAAVSSVVPVSNASRFSSSASFGAPLVNAAAPLRPAVAKRNVLVTRAALPQEQSGKTARREMLASLMAAGAVLATAGNSFAATGAGNSGANGTNDKAGNILKSADELTTKESPPRFGPGSVGGDESGQIAQKGGAGAVESLQGAGGDAIENAKKAASEGKSRLDSMFGKKTGDISDASDFFKDSAGKVSGKVSSDVDTTQSKVQSDISGSKSLVAEAQKKAGNAGEEGKGIVDDFVKNLLPQ